MDVLQSTRYKNPNHLTDWVFTNRLLQLGKPGMLLEWPEALYYFRKPEEQFKNVKCSKKSSQKASVSPLRYYSLC